MPQGIEMSQSRYVLVMLNSGLDGSSIEIFLSWSVMTFSAWGGALSDASFSVIDCTRSSFSSFSSPSSFLMILSCSFRKCLRCILDTESSICLWIDRWSSACSNSILSRRRACASLSCTSSVLSTSCRLSLSAVVMLAVMSASSPGLLTSTCVSAVCSCSLNECSSFTTLFIVEMISSTHAFTILSPGSTGLSLHFWIDTVRKGSVLTVPVMRILPAPATRSCTPSCCTLWMYTTCPRHPIWCSSSVLLIGLPSSRLVCFVMKSPTRG
mmetsp:Transcript_47858/g.116540  ORF Transcript_47858/g.116540 Transcript_47858/m.116540 type:complete len:268 (-) Transcript_47858:7-810(-)